MVGIEGGQCGGSGWGFEGLFLAFVGVFSEEGVGDADVVAVRVLLLEGEQVRVMLDSLAERHTIIKITQNSAQHTIRPGQFSTKMFEPSPFILYSCRRIHSRGDFTSLNLSSKRW